LKAELDFVDRIWREDHQFALLHDLTSCLRIGDATSFRPTVGGGWEAYLYEIKTSPNKKNPEQRRRFKAAEEAVRSGAPLPGDLGARLISVPVSYKTHLGRLRDAVRFAAERGVVGLKVPGGRALVAADLPTGSARWSEEEFNQQVKLADGRALRRARIGGADRHLKQHSVDKAARSPTFPPWAIFPLPAEACAWLIADLLGYVVTMSSQALMEQLQDAGLVTQWALPSSRNQFQGPEVMLRVARRDGRGVEVPASDANRLLLELVDVRVWAEGIDRLLAGDDLADHPWMNFRDEHRVWA
jgi:hypothetical protein